MPSDVGMLEGKELKSDGRPLMVREHTFRQ